MSNQIAVLIVKHYRWWLLLALLIAGLSTLPASRLRMDWSVERMFPPGDPMVDAYYKLQERFGGNQIALALYRDPQLWEPSGAGLQRLSDVSQKLGQIEGVAAVLSLAELHRILEKLRGPLQLFNLSGQASVAPLLDPDDDLAQAFSAVFEGYTHQRGSEYVAIACLLENSNSDEQHLSTPERHRETLAQLQTAMRNLPAPAADGLVTGEPVLVQEGFEMVRRDGWRLGITSSVLVLCVLLACFRSLRWTLIPIAVVHWALLCTQALLAALQLELTMISSTLTAIITVIGVATSMHILLQFQQCRRSGLDRNSAMLQTFAVLVQPVAWACVTDAVGFSALIAASVGPVRDFGLMMAIGSLAVLLAILLLVPGLALIGQRDTDPSTPKIDYWIRLQLRRTLDTVLRFRLLGLIVLVALLAYGFVGSQKMRLETDFTKNFRSDSTIVRGYQIIERELGGAGVWDIMLPAPGQITSNYLQQVELLEKKLRAISLGDDAESLQLSKVLSIADADRATQAGALLNALPTAARIAGMRRTMPEFSGALLSAKPDSDGFLWLRIMLRSRERAPAANKAKLVDAVRAELDSFCSRQQWQSVFGKTPPPAQLAGYHVMLGSLVEGVVRDQWKCFLLATFGILLVLVVATRSIRLAAVALIPNALPILLVVGSMGWLGIRINMGAAMIAAVSLGLSVDSSIHYLLHYQRRLRDGANHLKALRSAQESVGLAAILATVALIVGFMSLCFSEFVPTVVFGMLASLTMAGSLLGNLVVLPILLGGRGRTAGVKQPA